MTEVSAFKYHLFLSCSEADRARGNWLRAALEGYCIDENPVAPTGFISRSPRPIFCNREHISSVSPLPSDSSLAAPHLSPFRVVPWSPNAAGCACGNEKIRRFEETGRADRLIPVIVGVDPERESIRELSFRLRSDGPLEDLRGYRVAADARREGSSKTLAFRRVVGRLLGLGHDEIARAAAMGRRRHAMIRGTVAAGLLALTLACAGGLAFARYELARNDALLDRTLAHVSALTRTAVASSNSIGLPRSLSLLMTTRQSTLLRRSSSRIKSMLVLPCPSPARGFG